MKYNIAKNVDNNKIRQNKNSATILDKTVTEHRYNHITTNIGMFLITIIPK